MHHVDAFTFGIGYNYEQVVAPKLTISAGASLRPLADSYYNWYDGSSSTVWGIYPSISLDPRWYINYNKRVKKGKMVTNNSSNFVSLMFEYVPDIAIIGDDGIIYPTLLVTPRWGMRRSFSERFFMEFAAGVNLIIRGEDVGNGNSLHLDLKVGYAFNKR